MKRSGGLKKRWYMNTVGVLFALGMVCVMAVTALFADHCYRDLEAQLRTHSQLAAAFLSDSQEEAAICAFVEDFAEGDLQLQFVDGQGNVLAASSRKQVRTRLDSADIAEAVSTRGIRTFLGTDTGVGTSVMAVSTPMIGADGEVLGVLRFLTPTADLNEQILFVFLVSLLALAVILVVIRLTSGYCLNSVMLPIAEITEKAKRIAGGSYGIQIQTKYDDEIGELAQTINEMSAQISQNEKMQAEFISQLSHELRTPLTVINGWSETLLAGDNMDDGTRQGMKIISGEAKRLTEMVVELLDFTRMQDGRMTLNIEPTDIRGEFEDTVYMYGSRLAQDGIHLHYEDSDEDIPEIPCDPKRLRQVFLNILDNAAKHGGEGKRVEASLQLEAGFVVIRIRDFGPGIPEDEIPLVKKKFYKGSSKARGTGIGLAVADEIVEMHGGTLSLENAPGGGTLVTICLPAAE